VLDGSKMFITNGVHADLYFVAARTDPQQGFARPLDLRGRARHAGLQRSAAQLEKSGWLSSDTAELHFDGCRVPAANLLGEEHRGFYAIMRNFQTERIALAAWRSGTA
jgi:acyl-CoA dehydrogenase